MISFKDLKINTKILIGNLVILFFLLTVAGYSFYQIREGIEGLRNIYDNRVLPLKSIGIATRSLLQIRINMYAQIAASEDDNKAELERRLNDTVIQKKELDKQIDSLKSTVLLPEEAATIDKFNEAQLSAGAARAKFEVAVKDKRFDDAHKLSDEWLKDYGVMFDTTAKLLDIQSEEAQRLFDEQQSAFTTTITVFVIILALSIGASLLMLSLMRKYVSAPLAEAVVKIRDLAEGEGDLTQRLVINSQDEVGEVSKWVNKFVDNIHQIVKEMATNTEEVKSSSSSLTGASQNLSAGMEEMSMQSRNISAAATQMNQNFQVISSSVEEMSTSVGEVARNAADASKIAREADKTAAETNVKIKQLGDDAQQIGKVVEAIQGIASQTNLLALNAAIEAAGAGEAGKGFAVVASEVKELARQAAESTEEIKRRIEAIQGSADVAVESIAAIAKVISQINEFSASIASAVEEQSITAKEIAGNVNQSAQASSDVVANIGGISTATHDGAKNAEGLASLATQMDNLSSRLEQVVRRFKI